MQSTPTGIEPIELLMLLLLLLMMMMTINVMMITWMITYQKIGLSCAIRAMQ